jgi:hypothetical protein
MGAAGGEHMRKLLVVVVGAMALVGCSSSRKESREPATAAVTAPTPPQAAGTARPAGSPREQVNADLASAQARLQEAQRELASARAETAAADAEARSAQTQLDSAGKAVDSLAQARAAEQGRAAEAHRRSAAAHFDYADKLVAARQADVDAARAHVRTVEAGGGEAASSGKPADQRLLTAQNAESAARQRAAELGQAALAAQRTWEEASRGARALVSPTDAARSGTGSASSPAAPPIPPAPPPAPAAR